VTRSLLDYDTLGIVGDRLIILTYRARCQHAVKESVYLGILRQTTIDTRTSALMWDLSSSGFDTHERDE
jgi:hypothetical protein